MRSKIGEHVWLFGFSLWKKRFIPPFLAEYDSKRLHFVSTLGARDPLEWALKRGMKARDTVMIWGRRDFPNVERWLRENHATCVRVEDGFLRSVGLGSDLTRPYSLVFDRRGIYFDPTLESDLEHILQKGVFEEALLLRAQRLRERVVASGLSKYNGLEASVSWSLPLGRKILLLPGQVEDDASIIYGGGGMSNLELLQAVRKNNPTSYIVFKPHPDVVAGNRRGVVEREEAMRYCDLVVENSPLHPLLMQADEIHTITSLVGFEALIRGKTVHTYGMPFYAGWGLTQDQRNLPRRTRRLSLDQLVAATLILYPRYLSPKTLKLCEVEEFLQELVNQRKKLGASLWRRRMLGWRNHIIRGIQRGAKKIFKRG